MQTPPRVSIALPVYNGEKYLEKALDSILSQTFSDFELIISDNASTDRTQEICQTYVAKDQRIRYSRNQENLGAAKNYNRVVEVCSGKYFKWIAHDDVYAPEYLERCVEILDHKPDIILCYPRTVFIDEDDQVIDYYIDGFDLRSPKPHKRFRDALNASSWCNPVLGLIRIDYLRRTVLIGNYPSSDKVLLAELALLGQYYEIPEHLFFRRLHSQNSVKINTTDNSLSAWFSLKPQSGSCHSSHC